MSYKKSTIPVGTIMAWSGGYFSNASNGSFTNVLGNSVANANSYLNPRGFYVCDGAALNNSNSPIFNGASRFLPNLTDSRFLQGATSVGGIGGQNSVTLVTNNLPLHSHTINHDHGTHTHSINHDHGAVVTGVHAHNITRSAATNLGPLNVFGWAPNSNLSALSPSENATPSIDLPAFTGTSGTASVTFTGNSGNTGSGSSYENRPIYLDTLYIIKVV